MTIARNIGTWMALCAVVAGMVVFAVARPADAGGGCHEPPSDERATRVDMKGNCMLPTVLRIDRGDSVTFQNHDEAEHTVSAVGLRSDSGGWGSFEAIAQGTEVQHTFDADGVYVYYCLLHPGMVGAIVVDPIATTNQDDAREALSVVSDGAPNGDSRSTSLTAAADPTGDEDIPAAWLGGGALLMLVAVAVVAGAAYQFGRRA